MSYIYFFGCMREAGHYLWSPGPTRSIWSPPPDWPWATIGVLDGKYPLQDKRQPLGLATVTHHKGWTVLAMWDRSVDSRFNSNAAFIARGVHDFDKMLELACEHFPRVLARIKAQAPLVEVKA